MDETTEIYELCARIPLAFGMLLLRKVCIHDEKTIGFLHWSAGPVVCVRACVGVCVCVCSWLYATSLDDPARTHVECFNSRRIWSSLFCEICKDFEPGLMKKTWSKPRGWQNCLAHVIASGCDSLYAASQSVDFLKPCLRCPWWGHETHLILNVRL